MYKIPQTAEERLLCLFGNLLKLAFTENPLQDSGISLPQLALLDWIAVNPGCSLREIAAGLRLTPPTVSVAVRRLETAGCLLREDDPVDGRVLRFTLTAQGYQLYERALTYRRDKMRLILQNLSPSEIDNLLQLLEKGINKLGEKNCS